MSSTDAHSRRWRSKRMRSVRAAFVCTLAAEVVGQHERDGRRAEAVDDDEPAHELRERAGQADRLPAAERVRDDADRAAEHVPDEQREVEVQQRPREAGVERSAVAVTAEVDGDGVVAERGDARCEVVEHAAVVVGAVEEQHRRVARVAPAPQPQRRAVDLDELGPIRLAQDERGFIRRFGVGHVRHSIVARRSCVRRWCQPRDGDRAGSNAPRGGAPVASSAPASVRPRARTGPRARGDASPAR